MVLKAVLNHHQAVTLGGPGTGDRGNGCVAPNADEARGTGGVVGLDGLDRRMVGEEAPALLERHLVAERLPDVADRRAGQAEQGVTHGEEMLADLGDCLHHVAAFEVNAVDTTGAGDVFRGAFIYALLRGRSAPDLLRFANAAAGLSCTRLGALNGVPTLEETTALMER